jgi:ferritin
MQEMDTKLEKAMNQQIQKEFFSAYLYLAMAAYFDRRGLSGCSHWMKKQAKEELSHGMKIFEFLHERGQEVILEAIDQPPADFKSIKKVFEQSLEHEKKVTASINNLYALAQSSKDNATAIFLNWFINEQVEEEKNVMDILAKFDYIKEDSAGMIMLDKELGSRE